MKLKKILKINIFRALLFFFSSAAILTIIVKYTGFINRYSRTYSEPFSWDDYLIVLPIIIKSSVIVSILFTLIYGQLKKIEKKNKREEDKNYEENHNRLKEEDKDK